MGSFGFANRDNNCVPFFLSELQSRFDNEGQNRVGYTRVGETDCSLCSRGQILFIASVVPEVGTESLPTSFVLHYWDSLLRVCNLI